jgi:hypothetical protein
MARTAGITRIENEHALRSASVRLMVDFIKDAHAACEAGNYADAATCVRCAYNFEQDVLITITE